MLTEIVHYAANGADAWPVATTVQEQTYGGVGPVQNGPVSTVQSKLTPNSIFYSRTDLHTNAS